MRKVRWGVIGCGWVSQFHLAGIARCERAELVAVCDADEAAAARTSREHGAKRFFTDYRKLLSLDEVDAVDVVLPTHLHCAVACEAAAAGKHVLCEKPLAPTTEACRSMMQVAQDNGVLLMPMHNRLFYAPHVEAKKLVAEGAIGEAVLFQANFLTDLAIREDDFLASNWRGDRKRSGGGVVMESAVHLVYTAEDLLGRIAEVLAGTVPSGRPGVDTEDGALVAGRFADAGRFSFNLHRRSSVVDDRQLIVGTKGAIAISAVEASDIPGRPVLSVYRRSARRWEHPEARRDWELSFGKLIAHFTACVLGEETPAVTAEDGLSAIAVIEAIYASAAHACPTQVIR
ncbi:MAG: Gfo/Idh/MocA family oxidoreductase [Planctomycetota bacterium]